MRGGRGEGEGSILGKIVYFLSDAANRSAQYEMREVGWLLYKNERRLFWWNMNGSMR